jgi:hypothetical protein
MGDKNRYGVASNTHAQYYRSTPVFTNRRLNTPQHSTPMKKIDNTKVVVKWLDAKIYPGMHKADEALERKMDAFESLGYLIERNNQATIIAHEITKEGEYQDVLLIPSGSVISIQELVTSSSV